jgi:putative MATE family efflux protein
MESTSKDELKQAANGANGAASGEASPAAAANGSQRTDGANGRNGANGKNGSNGRATTDDTAVYVHSTGEVTEAATEKDVEALIAGTGNNGRGGWRGGWRGRPGGPGRPNGPGGPGGPGRPNNRQSWQDRDLTSGSIPKNLWGMAWPQSVEGVLRVVDQMLDLVWAGFLGTPHIAGIGVAQQYTQMAWTARMGVDTAQRAMVSRAIGMGNVALAQLAVFQAATVTAGFWVIIASIGIFFTEPMLQLLGVSDSVIDKAVPYMRVQFAGQGFMGFQQLFAHALMASGDPITPMKAHIVSRVTHGILSPLLVFGLWVFPELGITGAAVAAATGNAAALGICTFVLFTGRSRLHLKWSEYRIDARLIAQILRLGGPAVINGVERSLSQLILVRFVTPFGDNALAAFTLSRRVEMFANLGSQGFGQASGIIVGQNLGAGNPTRAKQTIYWALGYVLTIKTLLTVLLFVFPELFLSLFTRDEELLGIAATWVRIQCIGHLFMGSGNVFMQSFQTAGATVYPMIVTLIALWVVELPLAYLLSDPLGMGQYGIAWAVTIAMLVRPFFHVPYFLSGRWMKAKVFDDSQMGPPRQRQVEAEDPEPELVT